MSSKNIYSVGQVNTYIKNMFAQDFLLQKLAVKGEISNCKYHPSGHIYFTLKDDKSTMACVMFAGNRAGLSFRLEEGQQVVVTGSVSVYERTGAYQLYAKSIELDGAGQLYEKYEKLKKELEELGMFSKEYKVPIPRYIKTLGVITADTGAAVRDIIQIAGRRNPYVQIILYPAIVQGEYAVPSIVNGLRCMESYHPDVIIVGRGGGSLEDLWAFNEREVAQAIFDCSIPVISAVGHETDTTIADYVADLRAPTPSAAAELAVYEWEGLVDGLQEYRRTLDHCMKRVLQQKRDKIGACRKQLEHLSPLALIQNKRMQCLHLEEKLSHGMDKKLLGAKQEMQIYIEKLKGLSPLEKLSQGYSYTSDMSGNSIKSIKSVQENDLVRIALTDGILQSKVVGKEEVIWPSLSRK